MIGESTMPTSFVHKDFLLESPQAIELYRSYAESLPIIDYHCHLSPEAIATDHRFATLTEIWLAGDHYKWRAMRTAGVDERFITGNASDWEKFERWAETVPKTFRNPLYHWTHLELKRPFGIADRLLGPGTARSVWDECNALLATPGFSARGILRTMNVEIVCTTDDPVDSLEHHRAMAADPTMPTRVLPAFRPDRAMAVELGAEYRAYLSRLAQASGKPIARFRDLLEALAERHSFFHANGCRLSDHGLETIYADPASPEETEKLFGMVLSGKNLTPVEIVALKSAILHELALMDHEAGWVQQFHLGALRNTNSRMRRLLGPDTGYDSIGDFEVAKPLARFLDRLDSDDRLAKTILYNLNPRDNEVMATMIGNFQQGPTAGKIQFGSAWWFLDQLDGMRRQLEALSTMGLLSQFVGMLTDSRSFLSYPRHDYFRRLLCNIIGNDMDRGLIPDDMELAGNMVHGICYGNARRYFDFGWAEKVRGSAAGRAHA
jgi:glucuronate isomerase